ncbi:hypothetical protein HPB49_001794 [Dermacentor silvarum]|uniref:Uncharacterized protein n=1 Tax=Dermacentor silvarum TaxID=543639 RepID=A0ACB8DT05_DERSI|nr:hypothetical protein HPB49_001794 [Dermacentor silvarum]
MRHGPCLARTPVGRSIFKPPKGGSFGYCTSVRPGKFKTMLNVDFSATALYDSVPVVDFAEKFLDGEIDEHDNIEHDSKTVFTYDDDMTKSKMTISSMSSIEFNDVKVRVIHCSYHRKFYCYR